MSDLVGAVFSSSMACVTQMIRAQKQVQTRTIGGRPCIQRGPAGPWACWPSPCRSQTHTHPCMCACNQCACVSPIVDSSSHAAQRCLDSVSLAYVNQAGVCAQRTLSLCLVQNALNQTGYMRCAMLEVEMKVQCWARGACVAHTVVQCVQVCMPTA